MEATDATGTTAGRFAAHRLRRGGSLQWGDRELALRPATRERERYTLVDGDHVLAVLEGSCSGRRLAGRAGDLGADGGPAAGRARDVHGSAERVDAIGEAPEPGAACRVGAADAVVGDLHDEAVVLARDRHRGAGRAGVLGDVGEGLGDQVVGGDLDGRAGALIDVDRDGDRQRARARPSVSASSSPRSRTAGCRPAASSRSSCSDAASCSWAAASSRAWSESGARSMASRRSWIARETSRCWAPSWRSRSSRRRSASLALTTRAPDRVASSGAARRGSTTGACSAKPAASSSMRYGISTGLTRVAVARSAR